MAERNGLLNRRTLQGVPRVRIPASRQNKKLQCLGRLGQLGKPFDPIGDVTLH